MRKRIIGIFAAAIVCLVSGGVPLSSAFGQTMNEVLSRLVQDNPRITSARQNLDATNKAIDQAFSAFLPSVGATLDGGYEVTDSQARRAAGADSLGMGRESAAITVTQNLFDGSRKFGNLDIAEINASMANQSLDAVTQQVLFEGVSAYHEVLRQQRLVGLARASERTIRSQLELEDERVKRGAGIAVDLLLAKARLQIAKEQRVAFVGALKEAQAVYLQVFGEAARITKMVEPVPPMTLLPQSLDEAVAAALDDSPQVKGSEHATEVAQLQRRVARADYWPRVDLVAQANWEDDVDGVKGIRRDAAMLVRLTWEIFSGFATRSRVAQATAKYGESMANFNQAKRETSQAVMLSCYRLETAKERVQLLQNAVNIAGEVFDGRRRLREAGKETAINVLDAETEFYNAQINFTNASYDARTSIYAVLQAMGRLNADALGLVQRQ